MNNIYSTIPVVMVILATAFCVTEIIYEPCSTEIGNGTCKEAENCPYFIRLSDNHDTEIMKKLTCGFEAKNPKICCPIAVIPIFFDQKDVSATDSPKSLSKLKPVVRTTITPYIMKETDNIFPNKTICGRFVTYGDRVSGGTITQLEDHPWLARIRYKIDDKDIFGCSAILITDRYLLTAAHCVQKYKQISIQLGEWNTKTKTDCYNGRCNEPTIDVNVSKIIPHPTFNLSEHVGDIALIQLAEAITFTNFILPICLPLSKYIALQDYSSGDRYLAAGWGQTEFESESVVKREVELNAAPIEVCRDIYNLKAEHERNIICAGGVKGKDTCVGDSGGPLIRNALENYEMNMYLFGITSFGSKICGAEGIPGAYTRVSSYMDWIRQIIGK